MVLWWWSGATNVNSITPGIIYITNESLTKTRPPRKNCFLVLTTKNPTANSEYINKPQQGQGNVLRKTYFLYCNHTVAVYRHYIYFRKTNKTSFNEHKKRSHILITIYTVLLWEMTNLTRGFNRVTLSGMSQMTINSYKSSLKTLSLVHEFLLI